MTALIIVDTETSGIDPKKDRLLEVGAVLYDTECASIIRCESLLVHAERNEAEAINRIPEAALRSSWCVNEAQAINTVRDLGEIAFGNGNDGHPIYVAHNAAFDRQWLGEVGKSGRWICTYEDASWPRVPGETGSLTSIALAYDVGVVRAHRALEDCLTLAAVLTRVHELEGGLKNWIFRATESKREVIAQVSYQENQLAKNAGFRWNADRKKWIKRVRVSQLGAFKASLPFGINII